MHGSGIINFWKNKTRENRTTNERGRYGCMAKEIALYNADDDDSTTHISNSLQTRTRSRYVLAYVYVFVCVCAYIHMFDTIQTADRTHSMCQSKGEWRGADNGARCILNILYYIVYATKRINTIGSTAVKSGCRCSYVPCVKRPIVIITEACESICVEKTFE